MQQSDSLRPVELYPICQIGKGHIAIMPKPPADNLANAMTFYAQQGITHLVSLLRNPEIEALQLQTEQQAAAQAGLEFLHFPVKDMDVPDKDSLQAFIAEHLPKIERGAYYSFHCHGGRGRAGTLAISLLLHSGYDYQTAVQLASEKRQDRVPVCDKQRDFLQSLRNL